MCPHVIACVYKWMQYDAVHNYDDCIDRSFAFLRSTPDTTLLVLLPALWCTRGSSTESLKNTQLSGIALNAVDSDCPRSWSFKKANGFDLEGLQKVPVMLTKHFYRPT